MIFPLLLHDATGKGAAPNRKLGFISVDAPHPYAFHGGRGDRLIIDCGAIIDYLARDLEEE